MENKFNVKNFKEMIDLRDKFAQKRHTEKIVVLDHGLGNSTKLATTKHTFKKEVMGLQDGLNEKQHGRKMEQIRAVARSK